MVYFCGNFKELNVPSHSLSHQSQCFIFFVTFGRIVMTRLIKIKTENLYEILRTSSEIKDAYGLNSKLKI